MRESRSTEDTAVRIAAMKAAKDAAEDMVRKTARSRRNSAGVFALYTWGSLALICTVFAVVLGVFPDSYQFIPTTIAENQEPKIISRANPPMNAVKPANDEPETELVTHDRAAETEVAETKLDDAKKTKTDPNGDLVVNLEDQPTPNEQPQQGNLEANLSPQPPLTPPLPQTLPVPQPLDVIQTGAISPDESSTPNEESKSKTPKTFLGVNIGSDQNVELLVNRYAALKRRAPDLFSNLEPRIQPGPVDAGESGGNVPVDCRSLCVPIGRCRLLPFPSSSADGRLHESPFWR